eukprot:128051-Amphidinium_carterae.1
MLPEATSHRWSTSKHKSFGLAQGVAVEDFSKDQLNRLREQRLTLAHCQRGLWLPATDDV